MAARRAALDRVGFTVEDRDRSKGLYFVRYIDPEIDNKSADDKGCCRSSNSGAATPRPKNEQYRILVKNVDSGRRSTCSTRTARASSPRPRPYPVAAL